MQPECLIQATQLNHNVETQAGKLALLHDINLSIYTGESVAIVGASGSGKTTLLGMLAGLDTPSTGDVKLCGKQLRELDEEQRAQLRRESIGFIFQQFLLVPALSALENVMLPAELKNQANARELALDWLDKVGLSKRADHYPNQLSGGEQQRVAIARAFISQPAVLFADEPSANLDRENGLLIEKLLFDLNQQSKTTLVLVTHEPALAQSCQRILRMDQGRLTESSEASAEEQ
ncbi:ABC transporter ATP-binding protein [Alginatibacterium sediminis]|uniref:ABC transporter ATP-binding protein n=1 Tax=Alginatibacterium sediminis TaxID=2164068 RepID=A0A420EGD7_9ALTE|nr:ABC transporter ATP-binding protein [Alginatibacterium sediminis]RKF19724.1 ABC transporter ATP-binding protein [Alginatibacterium sediminis]